MGDWAVRLEGVSKRYPKGEATYGHLGTAIRDAATGAVDRLRGRPRPLRGTLALSDVSLSVTEGECFGLVGPNGAGKSTTLKLISRITSPTGGRVRVRGRVGALIEVGAGIHPELTGRENVWLYGSILGLSRSDIRRRFDSIVDFAQLPRAIDTQVKYYSSGMQLRLGFSIAAHLEPDVLVVDEALSVGDAAFQSRAVQRIRQMIGSGTTVVLVSHDLWAIEALCDRAVLIDEGRLLDVGPARDVVGHYLARTEEARAELTGSGANDGLVRFAGASLHDLDGGERDTFATGDGAEIRLRFTSGPGVGRPHVAVVIADIECSMLDDGAVGPREAPDQWECRLRLASLPLRPRLYEIWCTVLADDGYGRLMDWMQVGTLRVTGPLGAGKTAVANAHMTGSTLVPHEWDVLEVDGAP